MFRDASGPKFCRKCGQPWVSHELPCVYCGEAAVAAVHASAEAIVDARFRGLGSSIALLILVLGHRWSMQFPAAIDPLIRYGLLVVLVALLGLHITRHRVAVALVSRHVPNLAQWRFTLALALVFAGSAAVLSHLVHAEFSDAAELRSVLLGDFSAALGWAMVSSLASFVLLQEFIFRVDLPARLGSLMGPRAMVVVTGMMYIWANPTLGQLPVIVGLAFGLPWLRQRMNSVYPGICVAAASLAGAWIYALLAGY